MIDDFPVVTPMKYMVGVSWNLDGCFMIGTLRDQNAVCGLLTLEDGKAIAERAPPHRFDRRIRVSASVRCSHDLSKLEEWIAKRRRLFFECVERGSGKLPA